MAKEYAIHIDDPVKDKKLVDYLTDEEGYELVPLPDNDILLVPPNAQESVKNAAYEAQQGSYSDFKKATGIKDQE